jgi:hypothetical protein
MGSSCSQNCVSDFVHHLDETVKFDSKDYTDGQSSLLKAAQSGNEAVIKLLLETNMVHVDSKDIRDE